MRVQVTVEMEVNNLPNDDARTLARELVGARGLNVVSAKVLTAKGEGQTFIPKAGKPGSTIMGNNGIAYVVWGPSHASGCVWVTKRDNPDGLYYLIGRGGWAEAHHADGSRHGQSCACRAERVA